MIKYGEDVNAAKSYPSRSEALFDAVQGLIKAGIDDRISVSLLLDSRYAISDKPREKGPKWIAGELARAHAKLNGNQRAQTETPEPEASEPASEGHHSSSNGDEVVIDTIDDLLAVFRKWLYFQDTGSIEVLLGAYVANLMPGDAFWLMLVGPPSSGKTEPILATRGLPHVHLAALVTTSFTLVGSELDLVYQTPA